MAVVQDHLVATLPSWGPSYRVAFDIHINSHQPNVNAELLRVTASKNDRGTMGDRVPAIFSTGTGTLILRTQINDEADWYFNNKAFQVKEKTWYSIEIAQYKENNKVSHLITYAATYDKSFQSHTTLPFVLVLLYIQAGWSGWIKGGKYQPPSVPECECLGLQTKRLSPTHRSNRCIHQESGDQHRFETLKH